MNVGLQTNRLQRGQHTLVAIHASRGPGRWGVMRFHTLKLLMVAVLPLVSCATGDHREKHVKAVITDYGAQVLRNNDEASIEKELAALLMRLTDESNEDQAQDQARIPRELFFVEDAIKAPLRKLTANTATNALAARYVLWFIGDKSDITAMQGMLVANEKPLLAPGLTRKDLADAVRTIRETLKLSADHFRTEGLWFNRRMTKAYIQVVVGQGAFNSEGWGLMFHLGATGWELVWSKSTWIS